jgi:hypothetical protein
MPLETREDCIANLRIRRYGSKFIIEERSTLLGIFTRWHPVRIQYPYPFSAANVGPLKFWDTYAEADDFIQHAQLFIKEKPL